jgi:DNA-binding CsgD family transcriptional regulator
MGVAAFTRARDRLLAADTAARPVQSVCDEIVRAFHDIARFDACAFMTTDPETLLPSGGVVERFDADDCVPFWDNELLDADFNKFTDLARSHDPVVTLFEAVDGNLERSPRYRKLFATAGVSDELRAAFVAGTSCLAIASFARPGEAGAFTAEEIADARRLVPVATTVLRRALGRVAQETCTDPPIVAIIDATGEITAMSEGGQRLLDELRMAPDPIGLPTHVRAAATKARWSRSRTNITTRVRDGSGRWLRLHVTPMEGDTGNVAMLVENARPDDIVRILLESYGLTDRETDVVLLLARGFSPKEIAAELVISVHTVRDHIKTIYDKADVNSRGELVAKLFSNHVLEPLHATVHRMT